MIDLLRHELRMRVSAIFGWGTGLAIYVALYLGIYPEIAEHIQKPGVADFFSIYKVVGIQLGSFEAYLASAIVQFIPVMLGIYAIVNGSGTLAGEEELGTLELIIAMPLPRWQVVSAKATAMAVAALLMLVLAGISGVAMFGLLEIETLVRSRDIFAAIMTCWPITIALMMISLFLSSFLPSRRSAAMVSTVILIVSYFGKTFTSLVDSLEPFRRVSLFHYFDASSKLFSEGTKGSDLFLLLGVAVVFFSLTVVCFQRRNITVGTWPGQRPKR